MATPGQLSSEHRVKVTEPLNVVYALELAEQGVASNE